VSFGAIVFLLLLGLFLLGPKRMHTVLGQMARIKAQLEESTLGLRSQLSSELDGVPLHDESGVEHRSDGI
jgi:Sec-independent protein translocase protein TatA